MTEYSWGTSWRPKNHDKVDPTIVGQTIEELAAKSTDGVCSSQAFVDAARSFDSPLRPIFTWDDSVAGENWRRQEARMIIRALVMTTAEPDQRVVRAPAFISVKKSDDQSQGYVTLAAVLSDEQLHRQAIAAALASVRSLQRRYDALSELNPLWETLDKLQADMGLDE